MTAPVAVPTFDPVAIEVAANEFASLSEEMAIVIWRAGRSTGRSCALQRPARSNRHAKWPSITRAALARASMDT